MDILVNRPAASQDAAGLRLVSLVRLSPGISLIVFPRDAAGFDLTSIILRAEAGAIVPPLSWQRMEGAAGESLMLIVRAQDCLAEGGRISLADGRGASIDLQIAPAGTLDGLTEGLGPRAVLGLLRFIAAKATGVLRHSEDSGLAETCHAAAEAVMAPERTAIPVALCGPEMVMWALPPGVSGSGGVFYAVNRRRLRRISVQGNTVILRDRQFEEGYLLAPDSDGPIHLAPAGGRLPSLAELGRSKDPQNLSFYRSGLAELGRRASADLHARRLMRDLNVLAPTAKPHRLMQPTRPFGAALELGLCDHGGGAFFRGWIRDPMELIAGLTLRSDHGDRPLNLAALGRFARPDLAETFAGSPFGGAGPKAGFVAHLAEVALRPVAQWRLRLDLTTGDSTTLVAPPAILHPQGARDAVLSSVPPAEATPELVENCIAPAVAPLHAAVLALRKAPEEVPLGMPLRAPAVSIVVPLYRNLRFVRHQYAAFARDPAIQSVAELIYVLDSPEQRAEVEHLLRGLHGLYRMPLSLLIQSGNFGYASACNAGAEVARGSILLMLNSDVIPASRGWLQPMLQALATDPSLVAVGPKLLFEDGSLQHAGLFFEQGPRGEWFNNHYYKGYPRLYPAAQRFRKVPAVTGAALCVRRDAFQAVGGFCTDYVIGDYEDSDLCLKLRDSGGDIGYVPESELFHFERQSIRDHTGYTRSLASTYNRRTHHKRWATAIEALMARAAEMAPVRPG